jgi:Ca-activated chloride channel family protein
MNRNAADTRSRARAGRPAPAASRASLLIALLIAPLLVAPAPSRTRPAARPQDEEVLKVETDLVVLNVTATNARGEYVHGLKRTDFQVFEDGREQEIMTFSREETPFAAALLLDTSGSMEGRVSLARSAVIRFLDGLRADDNACVYSFNSKLELVQEFSNSRDLMPKAFDLGAKGWTVLNDAVLRAATDLSKRPEKRRAILVLSDGADTRSAASADKALAAALAASATIYTVDMGESHGSSGRALSGTGALKNFAGKSGGRFISTPGGRELREAFAEVIEELSNQYTVGYRPSNRARDGRWRTIEVKIARPEVVARTRRGYKLEKEKIAGRG